MPIFCLAYYLRTPSHHAPHPHLPPQWLRDKGLGLWVGGGFGLKKCGVGESGLTHLIGDYKFTIVMSYASTALYQGAPKATNPNRPAQQNQLSRMRRLRGELRIGVSGAGPETRQAELARIHRHGSTVTAIQAWRGWPGIAEQARLYRNGTAGTTLQVRPCRHAQGNRLE